MKSRQLLMILLVVFTVYTGCQILLGVTDNPLITGLALAFQSGITVLGVVVILYQMKRGHEIAELNFFIKLKQEFLGDTKNMELLAKLQNQLEGKKTKGNALIPMEAMRYLAFFDSVYLALRNRVISLEIIDDTLAYYFFIAVHNEQVQKLELVKYAGYYKDVYLLYDKWVKYRLERNKEIIGEKNSLKIKCPGYECLTKDKCKLRD